MKPTSRILGATLSSLWAVHALAEDMKLATSKGCFSAVDGFLSQGSFTFQSQGHCQEICVGLKKPVMALTDGSDCWCGDLLPATSSQVSDSECGTACNGWPDQKCGGSSAFSVLLTGVNDNVGSAQDPSKSDSDTASQSQSQAASKPAPVPSTSLTPTTTPSPTAKPKPSSNPAAASAPQPETTQDKPPSTITRASTVVVTAPGQTQPASTSSPTDKPSKGPNTAGIAAGVVVGVVAICAIAGGLFFCLRRRKRRALEEAYTGNAANPFETEAESKAPPSSHSMTDSRLEPSVMMQRRQSDGSIADNQDYSRRILKVTNPDDT
ncbi:MAG: hypothetical protein Q9200_002801 [Gallowayella weberi]